MIDDRDSHEQRKTQWKQLFRVPGSGCRILGLGLGVQGSGFGLQSLCFGLRNVWM